MNRIYIRLQNRTIYKKVNDIALMSIIASIATIKFSIVAHVLSNLKQITNSKRIEKCFHYTFYCNEMI